MPTASSGSSGLDIPASAAPTYGIDVNDAASAIVRHVLGHAIIVLAAAAGVSTADSHFANKEFEKAAQAYSALLEEAPDNMAIVMRLGACEYELGNYAGAETAYRRALDGSESPFGAELGLGRTLIALNRPSEAIAYLQTAVERQPESRVARLALARALIQSGRFFEPELLLNDILKGAPTDGSAWCLFGRLLFQNGYHMTAARAFDAAQTAQAKCEHLDAFRAFSLVQSAQYEKAETEYQRLAAKYGDSANVTFWIGYIQLYFETGRLEEALQQADAALRRLPDEAQVLAWRGRLLYRLGRLSEAATASEAAIAIDPNMADARNLLVRIYSRMGRNDAAQRHIDWLQRRDLESTPPENR